ncbi:tryptophan synthase subunit alpha, partial [Streptomyces sp. NPDC049916]
DGVIVGSAFVKAILDAPDQPTALHTLHTLATELAEGVRKR